jgi:hypothetical protein
MSVEHPEPQRIGPLWASRLESMLRTCAETRDVLPPEQTIDVRFDEFMADDIAMVRRVYEVAGQRFTEQTHLDMHRFMESHPRGRHGTIVYDFDDMALDPNELERRLDFYVQRFDLTREG